MGGGQIKSDETAKCEVGVHFRNLGPGIFHGGRSLSALSDVTHDGDRKGKGLHISDTDKVKNSAGTEIEQSNIKMVCRSNEFRCKGSSFSTASDRDKQAVSMNPKTGKVTVAKLNQTYTDLKIVGTVKNTGRKPLDIQEIKVNFLSSYNNPTHGTAAPSNRTYFYESGTTGSTTGNSAIKGSFFTKGRRIAFKDVDTGVGVAEGGFVASGVDWGSKAANWQTNWKLKDYLHNDHFF